MNATMARTTESVVLTIHFTECDLNIGESATLTALTFLSLSIFLKIQNDFEIQEF